MTDKDFRYTMPDGSEVEAFQMTPSSRYQEKDWPEWMSSRYLVTYDGGEQRLNIADVETIIPSLGWIVRDAGGAIKAVDYSIMEGADKVVKDLPPMHPEAEVNEEGLLQLASKLTGKSVEELREEEAANKAESKPPPIPEQEHEPPHLQTGDVGDLPFDNGLMNECRGAFDLLRMEKAEEAQVKLRDALLARAQWCDCPPGGCTGKSDMWDCRSNSPLVQT